MERRRMQRYTSFSRLCPTAGMEARSIPSRTLIGFLLTLSNCSFFNVTFLMSHLIKSWIIEYVANMSNNESDEIKKKERGDNQIENKAKRKGREKWSWDGEWDQERNNCCLTLFLVLFFVYYSAYCMHHKRYNSMRLCPKKLKWLLFVMVNLSALSNIENLTLPPNKKILFILCFYCHSYILLSTWLWSFVFFFLPLAPC